MSSQEQELFRQMLLNPQNRREFIKRAGALGLSASALTAFLEACGSATTSGASSSPTATVNMAGPIDLQTLMTQAKAECSLQAIGIPPEWADYKDILAGYLSQHKRAFSRPAISCALVVSKLQPIQVLMQLLEA